MFVFLKKPVARVGTCGFGLCTDMMVQNQFHHITPPKPHTVTFKFLIGERNKQTLSFTGSVFTPHLDEGPREGGLGWPPLELWSGVFAVRAQSALPSKTT